MDPEQRQQQALKLRLRALHFRQLADRIADDRAYAAAIALASEYAGKADAVARGEEPQAEGKAAT